MLGRDTLYVGNLQRVLKLHVPGKTEGYSQAYLVFLEKVIALRALHISQETIKAVFDIEKKCLRLLHVDTLTDSPTWYLDACGNGEKESDAADRLLLTGYRLGFPVDAQTVQHTLDFGDRAPELFDGEEMGEDVRRVLARYLDLVGGIRKRVEREKPVLENALYWAGRVFLRVPSDAHRSARPRSSV